MAENDEQGVIDQSEGPSLTPDVLPAAAEPSSFSVENEDQEVREDPRGVSADPRRAADTGTRAEPSSLSADSGDQRGGEGGYDEDDEGDEYDEEARHAGIRVISSPAEEDDQEMHEEPGRMASAYEDERATDERTKLDTFIASLRQTAGATGKVAIERNGPTGIPEMMKGTLKTVDISELEEVDVPTWLYENWGGGSFRLAVKNHLSQYRATVQVKVAGVPRFSEPDATAQSGDAVVTLLRDVLLKQQSNTGGSDGQVLRMMELRAAEDRESRKEELTRQERHAKEESERRERDAKEEGDRRERESKERIEQMRLDNDRQITLLTTIMGNQKPDQDPLELALKLSEQSSMGYRESIKFQQKAMTEAMTSAIKTSGDMHSSMVKHVLGTLRSVHESESDQGFLDKVIGVAGTLAGPAQDALRAIGGNPPIEDAPVADPRGVSAEPAPTMSVPSLVPAAAANPRGVSALTPTPVVNPRGVSVVPPPPGPDGALPRSSDVPAIEPSAEGSPVDPRGVSAPPMTTAEALANMTPEQLEEVKQQAIESTLIAVDRTAMFLHALNIQLTTDPDPEQAWNEIEPFYRAMPGKVRDMVEEATEDIPQIDEPLALLPFGEKMLGIFENVAGAPTEGEPQPFIKLRSNVASVKMTVLTDLTRAVWLRDFFDVAPWQPEDEDEEMDVDPRGVSADPRGVSEAPAEEPVEDPRGVSANPRGVSDESAADPRGVSADPAEEKEPPA